MKLIPHSLGVEQQQKDLLKRLVRRFRRSQNDLIREAIDLLGEKYEGKNKKEEKK